MGMPGPLVATTRCLASSADWFPGRPSSERHASTQVLTSSLNSWLPAAVSGAARLPQATSPPGPLHRLAGVAAAARSGHGKRPIGMPRRISLLGPSLGSSVKESRMAASLEVETSRLDADRPCSVGKGVPGARVVKAGNCRCRGPTFQGSCAVLRRTKQRSSSVAGEDKKSSSPPSAKPLPQNT